MIPKLEEKRAIAREKLGLNSKPTLQDKIDKIKKEAESGPKPKFKWPRKVKALNKKADKKPQFVVVQYLNMKNQCKFIMCKIVSGNIIVVNNKVHIIDPQKMWRFGKMNWYIYREIDRLAVSNEDYPDMVSLGRDTDADVPLIKAVLGAIKKNQIPMNPKLYWIIGLAAGAVVLFLMFYKG